MLTRTQKVSTQNRKTHSSMSSRDKKIMLLSGTSEMIGGREVLIKRVFINFSGVPNLSGWGCN